MGINKGKVYLVGAGPGDPKLITVRGLEALRKADVIVYDRLASPRLLQEIKPDAEVIYVGKRTDRHTMKQEDINQLLVELALAGKTVTRLKGGDPAVFGRVGEEAEELTKHGIEFDIVPGVTSAIAVPTYAGIPVTHRDYASSFAVVTGHETPDKVELSVEWDKLAPATDTLVFLMGVAKIDYISERLIQGGRSPDTPVALIRWGTRMKQRTLTGTLADITQKVREADFKPPAVILVGDVVNVREKLNWFEKKPLFGCGVLVTRSRSQASELAERIDELGGEAYTFPMIELREPSSPEAVTKLDTAIAELASFDWVIFTSANGVEFFFKHLKKRKADVRLLAKARVAAVGPKTAEALADRGILAEVLPDSFYQAEGLLEAIAPELKRGERVLLPRGDLARSYLPKELKARGLDVVEADVYENVPIDRHADELVSLLKRGDIRIATFTSSSTVTRLCDLVERTTGQPASEFLGSLKTKIACIGQKTAETAVQRGLSVDAVADEATIASLVEAVIRLHTGLPSSISE